MNPIVHFEIPAKDMGRAKEFYSKLFGWNINTFEGEAAANESYMTVETTKEPTCLGGGILPKMQEGHNITIYIGVDSVDEYSKKVEELGGKVCCPKMAVPKMGYFVCCIDTEENPFAIWEEDKNAELTKEQLEFQKKECPPEDCSCCSATCQ
ncbi:MAG: VOC family protein [Candidatus Aenigmarchaeota archaeon]|nr:VOC family protein [Candidatus Aenigmarchaeota archaeon]